MNLEMKLEAGVVSIVDENDNEIAIMSAGPIVGEIPFAELMASAANSYSINCGEEAREMAGDDLLGQAIEVIREMHRTLTDPSRELSHVTRRELYPWKLMLEGFMSKLPKK